MYTKNPKAFKEDERVFRSVFEGEKTRIYLYSDRKRKRCDDLEVKTLVFWNSKYLKAQLSRHHNSSFKFF